MDANDGHREIERLRTGYLRLRAALHDPVTALPAYPALMSRLRTLLDERRSVGVLHVRVEDLDLVEALYGWQVLDQVLTRLAGELRRAVGRALPDGTLLAVDQVAGDRFLAFVPAGFDGAEPDGACLADLGDAVRLALEGALRDGAIAGLGPGLAVRLGHAQLSENPYYRFERRVHGAVAEAGEFADRRDARRRHSESEELRRIVQDGDVSTWFQPVVDLASRRAIGYEALSRGPRGTAFERPRSMFAVSGRVGMDAELDRVCRDAALRECGSLGGAPLLFVNVLPGTLDDPAWLGGPVEGMLGGALRGPDRLVVEVSERALDGHATRARRAVEGLRERGFRFALDDVGTGYASLATLEELRPDFVKVDESLVREIDRHAIKREAMTSLVSIAGSLGADLIAEGVETEEEAVALAGIGVRLAQGFLFARPEAGRGEAAT